MDIICVNSLLVTWLLFLIFVISRWPSLLLLSEPVGASPAVLGLGRVPVGTVRTPHIIPTTRPLIPVMWSHIKPLSVLEFRHDFCNFLSTCCCQIENYPCSRYNCYLHLHNHAYAICTSFSLFEPDLVRVLFAWLCAFIVAHGIDRSLVSSADPAIQANRLTYRHLI